MTGLEILTCSVLTFEHSILNRGRYSSKTALALGSAFILVGAVLFLLYVSCLFPETAQEGLLSFWTPELERFRCAR